MPHQLIFLLYWEEIKVLCDVCEVHAYIPLAVVPSGKPVLTPCANSKLFVFYSGHGLPGQVEFPAPGDTSRLHEKVRI